MIAYKGFNSQIESIFGNGKKECCTFETGKTYTEKSSKTTRSGFHCCENPFDCLNFYKLDGENRFFQVEAEGDINEDGDTKIACTRLTLIKELTIAEFAYYGMVYIFRHPARENWKQDHGNVTVGQDVAEARSDKSIAIARGSNPRVRGPEGSILGLLKEDDNEIIQVKMFRSRDDVWMTLSEDGELEELHEKKTD